MRIEPSTPARHALAFAADSTPTFRTVIIDLDSVLPQLECFAWLARRRGDIVARRIAELANVTPTSADEAVQLCRERLTLIRPRRGDIDALASAYVAALPATACEAVKRYKRRGARTLLISSGLRYPLLRLGAKLEVDLADIHGIDVRFDALGAFVAFEARAPLMYDAGKRELIAALDVEGPVLYAQSSAQLDALTLS